MASSILAEGTKVVIRNLDSRPEVNGKEAEVGQFSEKEQSYECWLIDDALEGQYVFCKPEQIEVAGAAKAAAEAAGFRVGDRVRKLSSEQFGSVVGVDADGDPKVLLDDEREAQQRFAKDFAVVERAQFGAGDLVRGKILGKDGVVVSVDADGDPKVRMEGEREALQRFGHEFEILEKARFGAGDRVRGKILGKDGTVISVDADGDPKVKLDGEDEMQQRYGREFTIIAKASFAIGDRVRNRGNAQMGTVVAVDADGDPKVRLDGETEALQRFAKDFEISAKLNVDAGAGDAIVEVQRSRSPSADSKKGKKKKKRKRSTSSSSSSSRSGSSSSRRKKKKSSGFGKSYLEKMEEDKRRARKHQKKHGKHRSSGADAALNFLGLS